ncbi:MAG: 6-phosphofructokinase [Candidatus Aureabacteria bacterium]|nr:6-phosphofructokinase [Candidatus Auribacterota bacterium]
MATFEKGNAVIGQSGGPTLVINQSLVGIVKKLKKYLEIGKILGAVHGVKGILDDEFVDMKQLDDDLLEKIAKTPSSALGSVRLKPKKDDVLKMFDVMKKNDVKYFFYIGGNDTAETAFIINEISNETGYPLKAFHVPKTIDNDLLVNDHTPGFGSAAKFIAQAFIGDNLDNRSLPGIKVNIVMGRHAGFLTAASLMARKYKDDGPHLIYVPETTFTVEKFVNDVKEVYQRLGRCIIAVSEGVSDEEGRPIIEKEVFFSTPETVIDKDGSLLQKQREVDSHGNIQLSGSGALGDFLAMIIKEKVGASRVRADTFGYLQRSFLGCLSEVDSREARLVGEKIVDYAAEGKEGGSVAIIRKDSPKYEIDTIFTPLHTIAKKTKSLDSRYIINGNDIDASYLKYVSPLVGEIPEIAIIEDDRI